MRYPTDGLVNFFDGNRDLCHKAIALEYSSASLVNSSYDAPAPRAAINTSFLFRASSANSFISIIEV